MKPITVKGTPASIQVGGKPLTSHKHKTGYVWGSREDCKECIARDARIAEARESFRRQGINFTDGEPVKVNERGAIVLESDKSKLTGQLAVYTAIIFVCGMIFGAILLATQDAAMIAGQ